MPGCLGVPGAGAKCAAARAVIGAVSPTRQAVAASPEVNRRVRRGGDIATLEAAGTVMSSVSAAHTTIPLR